MARTQNIDFDGEPLNLVQNAYEISRDEQFVRNQQAKRDYKNYSLYIDPEYRDPDRANIFIPKIFNIVNVKSAKDVKALCAVSPYIPFTSKRKEFRKVARTQVDILDDFLEKGGFYSRVASMAPIKNLYGTAFIEAIPYHEMVSEKVVMPEVIYGLNTGRMSIARREVPRLRFRINTYAPWEVYVLPRSTGLEQKGQCRGVVKILLVSKREILQMIDNGDYENVDRDEVESMPAGVSEYKDDHWGDQMMNELGFITGQLDDDIGVLLRYESEERYIDVFGGRIVLRDIPNPYQHKKINLTRWVHRFDAHTQNQFWGIGEAKPNEILQAMLNDTWNLTFNTHEIADQMVIYYREGKVDPNLLVRTAGNRVPVKTKGNEVPIQHDIYESPGPGLPVSHYQIPATVERMMDLTSNLFDINRGERGGEDSTATEVALLKESGDETQELNVKLGEQIFMADFGSKCLEHIDQFGTIDDFIEVVGMQKAMELITSNPADLPGGYNFSFKGSDKVANQLVRQRNWRELAGILRTIPNVLPGWLATKLLEVFDVDDSEIEEGIIPDGVMMQLQMAQAQMAGQAPQGKQKTNSPQQLAQEQGQQIRGAA